MTAMTAKPRARYTRLSSEDRRAALIAAALACIAEGGIRAFTVDRIIDKARVSRGLITHHFGTMDALLAAVYAQIYATSVPTFDDVPPARPLILALLDHFFSPALFNREFLNIWLTLWAEISNTPDLKAEHRAQYQGYHAMIAAALTAAAPNLPNADALARSLICLVDGLGLQHCIDPDAMPATLARQCCLDLLTPQLGPLT
ncbi:MAG: TetR/AcrR family transcriptional regulator [bacterium]